MPGSHILGDFTHVGAQHLHVPAEHLGLRFGSAAAVDDGEPDTRLGLDRQDGEVIVATGTICGDTDLLGRLLGSLDHVLDGLEGAVRLDCPNVVVKHVVHQRREAVQVLLATDFGIEIAGIHARDIEIAQRVAVGRRRSQRAPAEPAPAAGSVLDRYGLAHGNFEVPGK